MKAFAKAWKLGAALPLLILVSSLPIPPVSAVPSSFGPPTLTLTNNVGLAGSTTTIGGNGYTAGTTTTYAVCFSQYTSNWCYGFTPTFVSTDSSGNIIPQTFNVPQATSGGYTIQIAAPACCTIYVQQGFTVEPTNLVFSPSNQYSTLNLNPMFGPDGQTIAVSANNLQDSQPYVVCLSGSASSCSGASTAVTSTAGGTVSTTLTVPIIDTASTGGASGNLWVDLAPFGSGIIASTPFIVTGTTITLSSDVGSVGSSTNLGGAGYAKGTTTNYGACFSQYASNYCYGFSPIFLTTDSSGNIVSKSFTVPQTASGGYFLQIVSPSCCTIYAQQGFTVEPFNLGINPYFGPEGQSITVTADDLMGGAAYSVCLSTSSSSCSGSPTPVTSTAGGTLSATLTAPFLATESSGGASGNYWVDLMPFGGSVIASTPFIVTPLTVSASPNQAAIGASIAVSGNGYAQSTSSTYGLCFSQYSTNWCYGFSLSFASTDAGGALSGTVTAPSANGNFLQVVSLTCCTIVAQVPFGDGASAAVPASLTLSSVMGVGESSTTIGGGGYSPSTNTVYEVCLSQYINSYCNGFSPSFISTDSNGNIVPQSFTIPATGGGGYFLQIVSPSCCTIDAQQGFTVEPTNLVYSPEGSSTVSLTPAFAAEGASIAASANNLAGSTIYFVCLSTSSTSCSGASVPVTSTSGGSISTTLVVPVTAGQSNGGGNENYWVDLGPFGGGIIAASPFVVTPTTMTVSGDVGAVGSSVNVGGGGYSATTATSYEVCLSQYINSYCNGFFPSFLQTDSSGNVVPQTLAIPETGSGGYFAQIVSPVCCIIYAQQPFTIEPFNLGLNPYFGPEGQSITVTADNLASNTQYSVCFTTSAYSCSGSSVSATSSAGGAISATVTVPDLSTESNAGGNGNYWVDILPSGGAVVAQDAFVVTPNTLTLSPNFAGIGGAVAITGSGYAPSTTTIYGMCFSKYSNSWCNGFASPSFAKTDATGSLTANLNVPSTSTGVVYVMVVSPTCCNVIQQSAFQTTNSITTVSCTSPVAANDVSTCTAAVTDSSVSAAVTPTGTVSFVSAGAGTLSSPTCTLSPSTGVSSTCTVTYTPMLESEGTQTITGTYGGDGSHSGSQSVPFQLTVDKRSTKAFISPTTTTVSAGQTITLTVMVVDSSGGTAAAPTGIVLWTDGHATGTFDHPACILVKATSSASVCSIKYTTGPSTKAVLIGGIYAGDDDHKAAIGFSLLLP